MYQAGGRYGQKASNEQNVTATTQTRHTLTLSTKTTLRHHSPELRHFKGIAAIHIKCLID